MPSDDDLAARLRAMESRTEILELTARYNEAWDNCQVDDWVSTFTTDGQFAMKGVPETKGPAALRTMIETMLPVGFVHLTVDHRIVVDGDKAVQRARVILGRRSPDRRPGSAEWVTTGSYVDELRRADAGWQFVSRTFAPDSSLAGLPAWW